jgi:membrane protein required for beta-lactamase induction
MRFLFIGLILMCVGLGMVLTIALENWLQGNSYLWWLLLVLLLMLGVTAVGITVFVDTHKLNDDRNSREPDARA